MAADDELIVVDNASSDGTPDFVRELTPNATVIETGANLGYGEGCNRGARAASGELLCFLNPDAVPAAGWRDAMVAPLNDGSGLVAWQGLVTAQGGTLINSWGGEVHFTGIAWAGGAEQLEGDGGEVLLVGEPGFVSGACLAIRRLDFIDAGAFAPEFFLYHEDVDLSLRLRLRGGRLRVAEDARVDHSYEFDKGPAKWRYLERNRWATLIRTYPSPLLALLAPALVATELALVPISIAGGWFGQKVHATFDVLRWLGRLRSERREIQVAAQVSAGEFAAGLRAELDSPYLGAVGRSALLRALLRAYWGVVVRILGGGRRA